MPTWITLDNGSRFNLDQIVSIEISANVVSVAPDPSDPSPPPPVTTYSVNVRAASSGGVFIPVASGLATQEDAVAVIDNLLGTSSGA